MGRAVNIAGVDILGNSLKTVDATLATVSVSGNSLLTADKKLSGLEFEDGKYLITQDISHHKAHEGLLFEAFTHSAASLGAPVSLFIKTPVAGLNATLHGHVNLNVNKAGLYELFEACKVTASGASRELININRQDTTTAFGTNLRLNPTVTTNGTTLAAQWVGTSGFKQNLGGDAADDWIMSANTQNLAKFAPESAADTKVSFQFVAEFGDT